MAIYELVVLIYQLAELSLLYSKFIFLSSFKQIKKPELNTLAYGGYIRMLNFRVRYQFAAIWLLYFQCQQVDFVYLKGLSLIYRVLYSILHF